jgi:hypothetical protein
MPGRRFASGGILWGSARDHPRSTPTWLSRNWKRYATKRQKDYKLTDGGGLYLLVRANGSKLWRIKYRFAGKERMRGCVTPKPKWRWAGQRPWR